MKIPEIKTQLLNMCWLHAFEKKDVFYINAKYWDVKKEKEIYSILEINLK